MSKQPNSTKTSRNKPFAAFLRRKKTPAQALKQKSNPNLVLLKIEGGIVCESNKDRKTNSKPATNMSKEINPDSTFKRKETHRNKQKNAPRRIQAL